VAAKIIRRNPYILMRFRGCGFRRCDAMYIHLGHSPDRLKRQALCARYSIASRTDGDTWFPVDVAIAGLKSSIGGAELQPGKALKLAKRAGIIATQRTDRDGNLVDSGGRLWIAESKKRDHEKYIAERLVEAEGESPSWPDAAEIDGVTDHQREQLAASLRGVIGIFSGAPGSGKTYTAAALVLAGKRLFGLSGTAVCAPTGKAAVRITEAMEGYGVPLKARTIHSLLGVGQAGDIGGEWSFEHGPGNPLPFRFIVVDEASMIDAGLMSSLLAARAKGACILFVGDVNQLPPVGHGAPLRDMIDAGLPYGELTEIHRQAAKSMIVRHCVQVRDGNPLERKEAGSPEAIRQSHIDDGDNVWWIDDRDQSAAMLATLDHCRTLGFDPVWDCQVLVAVNAKSELSRKNINKLLQEYLNSNEAVKGCPFRVGDKVVCLKNGNYKRVDSRDNEPLDIDSFVGGEGEEPGESPPAEIRVANGDLGEVIEIEPKSMLVRLAVGNHTVRVPRGKAAENDGSEEDGKEATDTGCQWDLAYGLTVHKSQGSEWPVVIELIDEYPGAKRICSREWWYTADSRAKKLLVMIGKIDIKDQLRRRVALGDRKTFLAERIEQLRCERLVEDL
jgi:exodeoxyribonuclease V alpha subunit